MPGIISQHKEERSHVREEEPSLRTDNTELALSFHKKEELLKISNCHNSMFTFAIHNVCRSARYFYRLNPESAQVRF